MKKPDDKYPVRISNEIRKLLLNALSEKGWYFFENPRLCNCWEEMNCSNIRCPSYKSANLRCWQISGTFCKGEPQGEFAKKFGDCQKCKVYKKATEGSAILQIGEDFNNLMFQLKTKEEELTLAIRNSEEKNRKLTALNDKINDLVKKLDNKNVLLRELSIKDGLTGLYNYRFFRELLHDQYNLAKRYKFPLSCVMIDIDYFKAVNDTYGHQWGDMILSQIADILKNNVRDADKVVRYGGEEFVIMLPYTTREDAYLKAERLRELVGAFDFKIGRKTLGITISLGIATYNAHGDLNGEEHLVSLADKALYRAKDRGRNQTVLYNGAADFTKDETRAAGSKGFLERRKYPRIQTLIKIKGGTNNNGMFSGNTFDISFSGLSLSSTRPVSANTVLKIKLYLPGVDKKTNKAGRIDLEGVVVWCRKIGAFPGQRTVNEQKPVADYLIGIRFNNISKKNLACLQKYFILLFKR
ncbi:MAG: diguanylate cyclase [Nitrospirae bacterium]|nr:diguanylate cyclase [Nitrospirota bacterium]